LGHIYLEGDGVPKDSEKARRLFTEAADAGHKYAYAGLGRVSLEAKDLPMAYAWFAVGAYAGDSFAKQKLEQLSGEMTPEDLRVGKMRERELVARYASGIQQPDNSHVSSSIPTSAVNESTDLNAALEQWHNGQKSEAKVVLERLTKSGSTRAQIWLSEFYIVEDHDLRRGRALLLPLAQGGDANAQAHLAMSYLGLDSASNTEGMRWLRRAADHCESTAVQTLAMALRNGRWGEERSPVEASSIEQKCATKTQ
jgi:TPR repeat protein